MVSAIVSDHIHTRIGAYLALFWTLCCVCAGSWESVLERWPTAKQWWWYTALLALFAYLYIRPYIRIGLGSASSGYINFTTVRIVWLVSALLYHLPSLEALGVDARADLALLIVVFLSSLAVLSTLVALHAGAVRLGVISPRVSPARGTQYKEVASVLLLNSLTLAIACSTYHSMCGNGLAGEGGRSSARALRQAMCAKWLHPIPTSAYPNFSAWMLYGEGSNNTSSSAAAAAAATAGGGRSIQPSCNASSTVEHMLRLKDALGNSSRAPPGAPPPRPHIRYLSIDFPLDGLGGVPIPAGSVLSPVLTLWITLVVLWLANSIADHAAAGSLQAEHMGELRRDVGDDKTLTNILQSVGSTVAESLREGAAAAVTRAARQRWSLSGGSGTSGASRVRAARAAAAGSGGGALARTGSRGRSGSGTGGRESGSGGGGAGGGGLKRTVSGGGGDRVGGSGGGAGGYQRRVRGAWLAPQRPLTKATSTGSFLSAAAAVWKRQVRQYSSTAVQSLVQGTERAAAGLWAALPHSHSATSLNTSGPSHDRVWGPFATWQQQQGVEDEMSGSSEGGAWRNSVMGGVMSLSGWAGSLGSSGLIGTTGSKPSGAATTAGGGPLLSGRSSAPAGGPPPAPALPSGGHSQLAAPDEEYCDIIIDDEDEDESAARPEFLPMVPWYSGTSADLLKTCFDLIISARIFLGRFDMRTMQAATSSSLAGDPALDRAVPSEGDGTTYEHYEARQELWVDFIADTGDGGNPTYTVARALASPQLNIRVPPALAHQVSALQQGPEDKQQGEEGQQQQPPQWMTLPRGDVLLLGGDLAYPNPTKETYEQRLLRPFSDALPPPPHFHPARMVVHKPDLPPMYGVQESAVPSDLRGLSPRASRHASGTALRSYPGPNCFAIPGNHDWIDGLETFMAHIQHKGWLGGWLLPQERSYFALRLPHNWWVFGVDLALTGDIDMCQLRYFANVVEQRMGPQDNVIIMTHEPIWLIEWFWQHPSAGNLRQLIRGHLRGRARVHLAGDLHFYMRHSFVAPEGSAQTAAPAAPAPQATAASQPAALQGPGRGTSKQATGPGNPLFLQQQQQQQPLAAASKQAATSTAPAGRAPVVLHPAPSFALPPTDVVAHPSPRLTPSASALPLPEAALGASPPQFSGQVGLGAVPPPLPEVQAGSQDGSSETGDEDTLSAVSSHTPPGARREARAAGNSQGPAHMRLQQSSAPHSANVASAPQLATVDAAGNCRPGEVAGASPHASPARPSSTSAEHHVTAGQAVPSNTSRGPAAPAAAPGVAGTAVGGPALSRHSSFSRRSSSSQVVAAGPSIASGAGASVVGGSSDDESESGYSIKSGKSARRLNRDRSLPKAGPKGMKAFGKALPAILVGGEAQQPWPPAGEPAAPALSNPALPPLHGSHLPTMYSLTPEQQKVVAAYSGASQGSAPAGGTHKVAAGAAPGHMPGVAVTAGTPSQAQELCMGCKAREREKLHHTFDPEHLICNGAGGAFLHPTHIFAPASFAPAPLDPAAEATAALYSAAQLPCTCRVYQHNRNVAWGGSGFGGAPGSAGGAAFVPSSPLWPRQQCQQPFSNGIPFQSGAAQGLTGKRQSAFQQQQVPVAQGSHSPGSQVSGKYHCQVSFPSPQRSLALGRHNLHLFRLKNTRFDVLGGMLYFLLVVSIIPRCPNSRTWITPGPAAAVAALVAGSGNSSSSPDAPTYCSCPGSGSSSFNAGNLTGMGGASSGIITSASAGVGAVLDASNVWEALGALCVAYLDAMSAILMESYVSLGAALLVSAICFGLARSGGVGAVRHEPPPHHSQPPTTSAASAKGRQAPSATSEGSSNKQATPSESSPKSSCSTTPRVHAPEPWIKARGGGLGMQLLFGGGHALAHVSVAVMLMLVLELGIEMCMRYENLGGDGLHTLFRWYQAFEAEHFPDPQGVRLLLERVTLGLYPGVIKAAMAVFDVPEAVAVSKRAVCAAGGALFAISRLQALAYYLGMLAYYWLLATPAVGAVFGLYLYICITWAGVHYDEAFCSLRNPNYKAITRMHVTREGDLEIFTFAVTRVPSRWREDPRWRGPLGGSNRLLPAHSARYPSRWIPAWGSRLRSSWAAAWGTPPAAAAGAGPASVKDGSKLEGAHQSEGPSKLVHGGRRGGSGGWGSDGQGTEDEGWEGEEVQAPVPKSRSVTGSRRATGVSGPHRQAATGKADGKVQDGRTRSMQTMSGATMQVPADVDWVLVDYVFVPRCRPLAATC